MAVSTNVFFLFFYLPYLIQINSVSYLIITNDKVFHNYWDIITSVSYECNVNSILIAVCKLCVMTHNTFTSVYAIMRSAVDPILDLLMDGCCGTGGVVRLVDGWGWWTGGAGGRVGLVDGWSCGWVRLVDGWGW